MAHTPSSSLRVGFVGAGRVAAALAPALVAAGHRVVFVAGRRPAPAAALAATLPGCVALPEAALRTQLPAADLYLLAVPDAAVPTLLATVAWPTGAVVAHLAGALSLAVFATQPAVQGGVLYPLQTFSAGRTIDWPTVPLFVEGATPAEAVLLTLAGSLSQQVQVLSSERRLQLHLSAVFASNFTNHLLGVAQRLLQEAGLSFGLLHPLVRETIAKALAAQPDAFAVQTGPAVRHDAPTLAAHQAALAAHPTWQALYAQLTASIQAQ